MLNLKKEIKMNCLETTTLTYHFMKRFCQRVEKINPYYNEKMIKNKMIKLINVHEANAISLFKHSKKRIIIPVGTKYRVVIENYHLITILLPNHEYKMEKN